MKANSKNVFLGVLSIVILILFVAGNKIGHIQMEVAGFLLLIIISPLLIFLVSGRKEVKKPSRRKLGIQG